MIKSRFYLYQKIKNYILFFFLIFKDKKTIEYDLIQKLSELYPKSSISFYMQARVAIKNLFENLSKNSCKNEIIFCSYNLPEIIDIARLSGIKIKLLDVDLNYGSYNLDILERNITSETLAVYQTNLYCDSSYNIRISNICKKNNIYFIEDCAIYFGFKIYQEKYFGSLADFSILSFGFLKNPASVYGGCLINNTKITIDKKEKTVPYFYLLKKVIFILFYKILISKFIYNFITYRIIKFAYVNNNKTILSLFYPSLNFKKKNSLPKSFHYAVNKKILWLILSNFNLALDFTYHRLKLIRIYNDKIKINELIIKPMTDNLPLMDYPLIIKSNTDELKKYLFLKKIDFRINFYSDCSKFFTSKKFLNAQYLEKNLICLPCNPNINEIDVEYYCEKLNLFFEKYNKI